MSNLFEENGSNAGTTASTEEAVSFDDVQVPNKSGALSPKKEDKPKTQYWINVGVTRNGKFLSLPVGIAMDNAKAKSIPSKAGEFQDMRLGEKALLDKVLGVMATLKPGESRKLALEVEIHKVSPKEERDTTTENKFDVSDLKL